MRSVALKRAWTRVVGDLSKNRAPRPPVPTSPQYLLAAVAATFALAACRATLVIAKLDWFARNARFLFDVVEGSGEGGVVFCDLPHVPPGPTAGSGPRGPTPAPFGAARWSSPLLAESLAWCRPRRQFFLRAARYLSVCAGGLFANQTVRLNPGKCGGRSPERFAYRGFFVTRRVVVHPSMQYTRDQCRRRGQQIRFINRARGMLRHAVHSVTQQPSIPRSRERLPETEPMRSECFKCRIRGHFVAKSLMVSSEQLEPHATRALCPNRGYAMGEWAFR